MRRRGPSRFVSLRDLGVSAATAAPTHPRWVALAVWGAWPRAVGEGLASVSQPREIVRGRLQVEVRDRTWGRAIENLESEIVSRLNALVPGAGVGALKLVESISTARAGRVLARSAAPRVDPLEEPEREAVPPETLSRAIRDDSLRRRFREVARRYANPRPRRVIP